MVKKHNVRIEKDRKREIYRIIIDKKEFARLFFFGSFEKPLLEINIGRKKISIW